MKKAETACDDPKYRKTLLANHKYTRTAFDAAVQSYWGGTSTGGNTFSADEMNNLLSQGTCGDSLLLCTAGDNYQNDIVLDMVASSGQPVPPDPVPKGSFACVYSYDLLYAVMENYQPDKVVFYKACTPAESRAIIFKAVKNNVDVYFADFTNDIP